MPNAGSVGPNDPSAGSILQSEPVQQAPQAGRPFYRRAASLALSFLAAFTNAKSLAHLVAGGVVAHQVNKHIRNKGLGAVPVEWMAGADQKITAVGSLENPNPDGIEVLVFDQTEGGAYAKHSGQVAYVVNSHLDHSFDVETLVSKDAFDMADELYQSLCKGADKLQKIALSQDPPEVLVSCVGVNDAWYIRKEMIEAAVEFKLYQYVPSALLPVTGYGDFITKVSRNVKLARAFGDLARKQVCPNGMTVREKLTQAHRMLVNAGVTVVLAAGNEGEVNQPAATLGIPTGDRFYDSIIFGDQEGIPPGVLVIGGVHETQHHGYEVWSRTTPNKEVDLAAESVDVPVARFGLLQNTESGTSFAAPKVAAIIANMKAINPGLRPEQIEIILKKTADPIPGEELRVGAGVVNADKAYAMARDFAQRENV